MAAPPLPSRALLLCTSVLFLLLGLLGTASAFVPPVRSAPVPQRWCLSPVPTAAAANAKRARHAAPRMLFSSSRKAGLGRSSPSPPPAPLPGTTLVLEEPASKTRVYIVGCVHGARASEEDVAAVIEGQDAGVVVLELCDSRFQSMQAEEEKQRRKQVEAAGAVGGSAAWAQGLSDFGSSLKEFNAKYGPMQTALVALLSSSAAAQRMLQAGRACEFRRSVELAEAKGAAVVLGDQELSITLNRFKQGWKEGSGGWWPTLSAELASISDAVLGPKHLPDTKKVQVLPLLFTQGRYLRELLKVLLPVSAIVGLSLQAMQSVGEMTLASLQHVLPAALFDADATAAATAAAATAMAASSASVDSGLMGLGGGGNLLTDLGWAAANVVMLGWFMALNQVILVQRDAFLARSIAETCRKHPGQRVAAVVGLLHGNGVARHLSGMGFRLVDRE